MPKTKHKKRKYKHFKGSRKGHRYYTEETLIDLVQRGIFSWVDYVTHYSPEWEEEYYSFLREMGFSKSNQTALAYIAFREDLLETQMEEGNL